MTTVTLRPFDILGTTSTLSVGATTGNIQVYAPVGVGTRSIRLFNSGTSVIFFNIGATSAVTADTTTSTPMLPNSVETFLLRNENSWIAAIGASAGNTLYITTGESA